MSGPSNNPLKELIREAHRRSLWQVLGIYVVSGWVVYEVVQSLTEGLGLPGWLPGVAFVLLLIGLPIVLATAFVQEGEPEGALSTDKPAPDNTRDSEASSSSRLFTWRNAILGGVAASLLWAGLAAGWLLFGEGELPASLTGEAPASESSGAAQRSVAVLPFDNMSADPDNEYFSDGITEEILHALAQVRDLRVPARTSSFAVEDANLTMSQIADTLDVTHVVEGSVRRAGDRVRITAQLIEARDDEHLWSETYERSLEDVFAVQAEIARSISNALEVQLAGADSVRIAAEGTDNPEAHDAYLRGRYFWNQRTAQSLRQAAKHFRTAIERDSTYAEAWSGLADTYSVMPYYSYMDTVDLDLARLRGLSLQAAERSVELAPDRAMTHASLAFAHFFNGHWSEAEWGFERAIELNPGYATVHQWYGEFLIDTDRVEESLRHLRRAVDLDPVSKVKHHVLANGLAAAGRFDEALERLRRTRTLDPSWPHPMGAQAYLLLELGQYEESIETRLEAMSLAQGEVDTTAVREMTSCMRRYLETGQAEPERCEPPDDGYFAHALIGQKEPFLRGLEKHIESGNFDYRSLAYRHTLYRYWSFLDPRDDPRYQELMERVGIDW